MQPEQSSSGVKHVEWLVGGLVVVGILVLVFLFRSQQPAEPSISVEPGTEPVALAVAGFPEAPGSAVVEEIVSRMGMVKVAVSEYWQTMGQPPTNNEMAGLSDPEGYSGRWVRRVEVLSSGNIMIHVDDRNGQRFRVELRADYRPDTGIIDWRCFSSHPLIRRDLDQCTYAPE
ncbi:MAG: pilin [Ahniella sp.]|nr:pilin [Ahniella sp.]